MSALLEFEARLDELENILEEQGLLPNTPPSPSALSSTQPFAIDTMPFTSWLAFVFISKCRQMIAQGQLPPSMAIAPAAEVYLPNNANIVIEQLYLLDALTQSNSDK
ncbi:YqcC family protein [Alteromonas sp. 345S023]|uniref:YqcC family protein n=1 Tax=Alteromonas profundi TaxID=2696062 RepID=A0A7X5LI49_9ALTE|nr:YqcC family protein [Alteromonas profundi]NDV89797.1 YqcC family protein [Alteromonas profundi]